METKTKKELKQMTTLTTASNSAKLAIINEAIASGNYKTQMDCVRYLKAAGFTELVSKKKEAVSEYLNAIAQELLQVSSEITEEAIKEANDSLGFGEAVVIAPAQIELNLDATEEKQLSLVEVTSEAVELFTEEATVEATTEAIAVKPAPAIEASIIEMAATEAIAIEAAYTEEIVNSAIAAELISNEENTTPETAIAINGLVSAIIPTSNDLKQIQAIILMAKNDDQILDCAYDFGSSHEEDDVSAAKQFLKDLLVAHGYNADPVSDILNKKPRTGKARTPRNEDKILINPRPIEDIKATALGTKSDYLVKAIARQGGSSIEELSFIHHWSDNIKPALAYKLGVNEADLAIAQISEDPESITQIIEDVKKYGITPGMDNMPKLEDQSWISWDNGRVTTRLNHRGPGYGCEKKGGRYYIVLPDGMTEILPNTKKTEKSERPQKTRAPRITQQAIADQLNDLQAQNQLLMQQLEALKAAQSVTV